MDCSRADDSAFLAAEYMYWYSMSTARTTSVAASDADGSTWAHRTTSPHECTAAMCKDPQRHTVRVRPAAVDLFGNRPNPI